MVKQLVVITGRDEGRVFLVPNEGTMQIGRGSATTTRLSDLRVSRNHCELQVTTEEVVLTDLKSAVGTYVNEQRLEAPQRLMPGDVIKIGDTEMRYQDDDVADLKTMAGFAISDMIAARGVAAPAARPVAETAREPLSELVGTTLGPYEIKQLVAQGLTSVLFRAHDPAENRSVALKVLRPECTKSDGEMQRLARAIQPLTELRHPNLVALYGVGKSGPHCWIALEYVEGENLNQVIQRIGLAGMLDWQHALRVALHIIQALDYLHQHDVVHNNVTPKNILINSGDKRAKLSALMRAKTSHSNPGETFTRPGEFLRDLAYMSPERAKDNARGDGRSDLYSLGATLYALLTGRPPFEGKSPVETIVQIMQSEPVRPREFQLALPEAFEHAVLRMLAKQPDDRYQTAAEVLADLERVAKNPGSMVDNGRATSTMRDGGEKGIVVTCTCGQRLQARERYAGTRVRCPACGNFLVLPGQPMLGQTPPPPPQPPQGEARRETTPGERKIFGKRLPNPAALVVGILAVLAVLALVASFLWAPEKSSSPSPRPKKTPATTAKSRPGVDNLPAVEGEAPGKEK